MKKDLLSVILGFAAFVLLFTYPAIFHLSDKIIGDGGDNYQFLAFQYLANQQFEIGQFPFGWTNYWRYPVGFDLSVGYDSSLLLIAGIVFYRFFSDPVIVYNLSVLLFLFLNCFLSYLFFKKITGDKLLGFIGGLIYGFSFYNLARMGGHTNLILTGCFPFFFYALHEFWDREGDAYSFRLLASSVILVFLVSLQYGLILAGGLLIIIPLSLIFYKEKIQSMLLLFWQNRRNTILSLFATGAVLLFFYGSKVMGFFNKSLVLPGAEIVMVPPINYLLPNQYLKILPSALANNSKEWLEYAVYLGFLEMILFIAHLLLIKGERKLKLFLLSTIAIFTVLALGDLNGTQPLMPYALLFHFLPFRGVIEPGRFYIFLYLALTVGIVTYLKSFFKETGKIGIVLVLAFIILERLPTQFYLSETLKDEVFIEKVAASESKAVLDLPIFREWWNGQRYDLYSIYYQKPIVNGYIHWSADTSDTKFFLNKLKRYECNIDPAFEPQPLTGSQIEEEINKNNELAKELRSYGIRAIVFHKDLSLKEKPCIEAVDRINILLEQSGLDTQTIYDDADTTVYHLGS